MREIVIALGLIEQGGNYLLQLRDGDPTKGAAGMIGCFGGKIEKETPKHAVSRELNEETNLKSKESDFEELGEVEVISDNQLEEVNVKGYLFKIIVEPHFTVEALEGELVTIPKGSIRTYLHKMTPGTQALFKNYILGEE